MPNPKPKHVLHVVPTLGPGGMELAMSRVINALIDREMRHTVVCLKGEPEIAARLDPSVSIHCMHARPNDLRLPWRLARLLKRLRPDVIHARNWSAWPDIGAARALARPSAPLIYSFHGLDTSAAMPARRRWASRVLAALTTRIFTVCRPIRRMLVETVGLPPSRVEVIPNGVDTEAFSPSPGRASQPRLIVGTTGNLTPVKNQALLVRACASLVRACLDLELHIAGEGPERPRLVRLAADENLGDRLHLHGRVEDVPAFLAGLDIFALPSDSEAHPNALLEAMACGLPCVATHVGGVPDVLDGGRAGLLIAPDDAPSLAMGIRSLAEDRTYRETLGRLARRRIVEHYSMAAMVDAYRELYRAPRQRPPYSGRRARKTSEPRVLMLGPTPPATGGMATVVDNLRQSPLAETCRLRVLDTGKTTREGRSLATGVATQVRLLGRIVWRILTHRAQIIHIHTCSGFTFWRDAVHAAVVRAMGCRLVWHIHGGYFDEFCASMGPLRAELLRCVLGLGAAVIVVSDEWRRTLEPVAPGRPWYAVPNGVPIPELPDRRADGPVRFLFLGNLRPGKGAEDLVRASGIAVQKGFDGVVDVVGPETVSGRKAALTRLIGELGCGPAVRLVGSVTGDAKEEALRSADVFVLPSHAEGLPVAMLEAMAYGLPVVATRVGGIPAVVKDGVEGFLIEVGDVDALADRMLRLSQNPDLRQQMGNAARHRTEAEFSIDHTANRIMAIYGGVLGREGDAWR